VDAQRHSGTWPLVGLFFTAWVCAWLLHQALAIPLGLADSRTLDSLYWIVLKLVVWVALPLLYFRRRLPLPAADYLGMRGNTLRRGLRFGLLAAALWVVLNVVVSLAAGMRYLPDIAAPLTLFSAVLFSPLVEELVFRGYILPGLQREGSDDWTAIVSTALLFLLVHCVGWFFMGTLLSNLLSYVSVSILLLGVYLGWVRVKSGSVAAPALVHLAHNIVGAFIR
jgi:membrane protease YdiL (CAAX protease family)